MTSFTGAQRLKFQILEHGLDISDSAADYLRGLIASDALTPADYASTSGIILLLDDDVWVNAPISNFNPNFVQAATARLDVEANQTLVVRSTDIVCRAKFWLPPTYHEAHADDGWKPTDFVFTHGDRARVSPIRGCSMRCQFCNLPYESKYGTKPLDPMLSAIHKAMSDPRQPARHLLISGGTPSRRDIDYLQSVYEAILLGFPDIDIDIMMAPIPNLFDLGELDRLGLHEISVNVEIYDRAIASNLMPHKFRQGRDYYLDFIEEAAGILGPGRVRSMLLVGLESADDTVAGVRAIAERGCIPVLSPFRPDTATPLHDYNPPSARFLADVYLRAQDAAHQCGQSLGPNCPPCTHNTLTFAETVEGVNGHSTPRVA